MLIIMALVTTVVNLLVIIVLSITKKLKNSQSTYKLSLAAADLLVGVLVLPTCYYNLSEFLWHPLTTTRSKLVSGYSYDEMNRTFIQKERSARTNIHENLQNDGFTLSYLNGIGFMTTLSIFVSIYTLAAAGFDRFFAVYKPLSYNKVKANKYAKIACVISWILAGVFSLLPIFAPPNLLRYGVSFQLIVASLRTLGIIIYAVILLIPLIVVWIVNIMIYIIIRKHTRTFQRKLTKVAQVNADDVEKRLAATLRLMVGVFTFNTLPLWLTFLSNLFVFNVRPQIPETLDLKKTTDFITVQVVAVLLLLGNSLWNFLIYNVRNEDFRKALKHLIKAFVKKVGLVTCCRASRRFLRNATGHGRRKLSSVSLSILNLQKKSGTTEEIVMEKTTHNRTQSQQTRESLRTKSESDETETSTTGKRKKKKSSSTELPSVSEPVDSVFNSYVPDIGVSIYSSVMRKVKNTIETDDVITENE